MRLRGKPGRVPHEVAARCARAARFLGCTPSPRVVLFWMRPADEVADLLSLGCSAPCVPVVWAAWRLRLVRSCVTPHRLSRYMDHCGHLPLNFAAHATTSHTPSCSSHPHSSELGAPDLPWRPAGANTEVPRGRLVLQLRENDISVLH